MRKEVADRISEFAQCAEDGTASVLGNLVGQVQQAAERTEAQASRAIGTAVQQLEAEIRVVASSATAASERVAKMAVADTRSDLEAQLDQIRAESLRRDADSEKRLYEISNNLSVLTEQLNKFHPASAASVVDSEAKLSSVMEEKLNLQSNRIDEVSQSVQKAQKVTLDNTEILHDLLIGLENLGDSVK